MEVNGDLKEGPVIGTGPFLWNEWQPNQVAKVKRNPDYWRKGADGQSLPYADELHELRIRDTNLQISAFRTKQIDGVETNGQTTDLLTQTVGDLYVLDAKLMRQTGDRCG